MSLSLHTENDLLRRAVVLLLSGKTEDARFLLTDAGTEAMLAHDAQQTRLNDALTDFLAGDRTDCCRLERERDILLGLHGQGRRTRTLHDARGKAR